MYRIIAVSTAIAEEVRRTMKAPTYGHPAHREVARGYGPCRHCLRTFRVGAEERILFTYDAFHELEALPLPGPVFVHAEPCERYPEDAGFPADLRAHKLTLNAYGAGRRLITARHTEPDDTDLETTIAQLLATPEVDYVHVRDTSAGCYDCLVRKSSDNGLNSSITI